MLHKLRKIFVAGNPPPVRESDLRLAAALLLVEVAKADYSIEAAEEDRLFELLQQQFKLAEDELTELRRLAEDEAEISISLHRHLDLLNSAYSPEQKISLLKMMWQMAYADGDLHRYEEHLIRRVADLLYIPHKDFIRTKHQVIRSQ